MCALLELAANVDGGRTVDLIDLLVQRPVSTPCRPLAGRPRPSPEPPGDSPAFSRVASGPPETRTRDPLIKRLLGALAVPKRLDESMPGAARRGPERTAAGTPGARFSVDWRRACIPASAQSALMWAGVRRRGHLPARAYGYGRAGIMVGSIAGDPSGRAA